MAFQRAAFFSSGLVIAVAEYFTYEDQVSGCVSHPDHTDHPLDKCNSQNDPSGCTGGQDAADCYCVKQHGPGAHASSVEVAGGKDHTWSCSKDHENFCLGACDCLKKITCKAAVPRSVQFCATYVNGCPGALPGSHFDVVVEDGYSESTEHTETQRIEFTNSATAGADAKLPDLLGGIGITGKDAIGFSQVTETSWKKTHSHTHSVTVSTHIECTREVYYYSGETTIEMDDGYTLRLESGSAFITFHQLPSAYTCVTYRPTDYNATDVIV